MTAMTMGAAGASANISKLLSVSTQAYANITFGGTARSGIRVDTDGYLYEIDTGPTYTQRDQWLHASGTASDYEVIFTLNAGTLDGGVTAGTPHTISVDRDVYIETETVETDTANLTVQIRKITNTSDSTSFTNTLSAQEDTL